MKKFKRLKSAGTSVWHAVARRVNSAVLAVEGYVERRAKFIALAIAILVTLTVGYNVNVLNATVPQINDLGNYVALRVPGTAGFVAWLLVQFGSPFLLWPVLFLVGRFIVRRVSRTRVWKIGAGFWISKETRWKAGAFIVTLLVGLVAVNYLNVVISFVGRDFYQFLQAKDEANFYATFWHYFWILVIATPILVAYSMIQSWLTLAWRRWLTTSMIGRYFADRRYYHIAQNAQQAQTVDNPDERISEDASAFTGTALSLFLAVINAGATLVTFALILYTISPTLMLVAIAYAGVGTVISLIFGRRFSKLNFNQSKLEANFRFSLVRVRLNTEQIALYHGEAQERSNVERALAEALTNVRKIIVTNFGFGIFYQPFGLFNSIVPSLVLAAMYFKGDIDFGQIIQASTAFSQVLSSLTIVVDNIQGLASFQANINRLTPFIGKLDAVQSTAGRITYDHTAQAEANLRDVTVVTPDGSRTLVTGLNLSVTPGTKTLIVGPSGVGKSSLIRALTGLWQDGAGQIQTPPDAGMLVLPQKPYMPLGTLMAQLVYPKLDTKLTEAEARSVLAQFNLPDLIDRFEGGLLAVRNWADVLSLGEQQRLAFARASLLKPKMLVLDEATSAIDVPTEKLMYEQLLKTGATVISVGHRPTLLGFHDHVLELHEDSSWKEYSAIDYAAAHATA